jgi:signal transduction histidine kinase
MQSLAAPRDERHSDGIVPTLRDRCRAHDLKNLMTVVVSATEALAKAEAGDAGRAALALASLEAARRGAAVLRDLLADVEPAPRARASLACADILRATVALAALVMPAGVSLVAEPTAGALRCSADRDGLDAALMNLCKNAGEASPAGGVVTLSAVDVAPACAHAIGLEMRGYVRFEVRDAGPGMSPQVLAAAGRPGVTTRPGGHGLGLVSVAEFARREGGALRIVSRPGEGCAASLYLPQTVALVRP